jgi:serine/threonine protein kinase
MSNTFEGSGSFGVVYKGTHNGSSVAIKKSNGQLTDKQIEEFLREAEITRNVPPHPNVIRFVGLSVNPLCISKYISISSLTLPSVGIL